MGRSEHTSMMSDTIFLKSLNPNARWINTRIESDVTDIGYLRQLMNNVRSSQFTELPFDQRDTEARFVRILGKVMEYEERVNQELEKLVKLRNEVRDTIMGMDDELEKEVLIQRYLLYRTWEDIGDKVGANERTVRRWHDSALQRIVIPENAMMVKKKEVY